MDKSSYPVVAPATAFCDIIAGEIKTTSLKVAEFFGKQHSHVLRDIERLDCTPQFRRSNFGLSDYVDLRGKTQPMYELSRDGFMFLCMGYTGPKAGRIKEAYIGGFNQMALEIRVKDEAKNALVQRDVMKIARELISSQRQCLRAERRARQLAEKVIHLSGFAHHLHTAQPKPNASLNQLALAGV